MKRTKRGLVLLSCSILLAPFISGSTEALASRAENAVIVQIENDVNQDEVKFNKFIEAVEPYVFKAEDGTIQIAQLPNSIELIHSEALNATRVHLQQMNADVLAGRSYTTGDLKFVSKKQMRSNTPVSYWWGYQYTFTNAEAKRFANSMDDLSYGVMTVGAFIGAFGLGPIGPAVGTVSSLYWKQMASKVRQKNTSRGAIVNITRAAVFTVNSR